jgi:phenylalanyl-tRNA synthetase alpha chain
LSPIVSIENNFDVLNVPKDHISRSKSDTYYINNTHLLRTHTSAHQKDLLSSGINNFVVFGKIPLTQATSTEETKSTASTTPSSTRWRQ